MTQRKPRDSPHANKSLFLVSLMLASIMGALVLAPSASAALNQSLGLKNGVSPAPNSWHSSFDPMSFTVEVENLATNPAGLNRGLAWYACEGNVTANMCKSNYEEKGVINIGNINGGTSLNYTSASIWTPGQNSEGIFTIVFAFDEIDQSAADDVLRYTINITVQFTDIIVNQNHNPLENINNLATYDGEDVLNSNTDYVFNAKGQVSSCGNCGLNAMFGWQLWTHDETSLLKESYISVTNLPSWGGFSDFNINLPSMNYTQEGRYILKWGAFNTTGTIYADMNVQNNLAQVEIVLDDSHDIVVSDIYPSHNNLATEYYYGTDRVHSVISNNGNISVVNMTVLFEVYSPQFDLEVEESCEVPVLWPGDSTTCVYNLTTTGANRLLRVRAPSTFLSSDDVRPSDNVMTVTTTVEAGTINPYIQEPNLLSIYQTSDDIELVARASPIASQPLNFTWREGFFVWGYGQVLNQTGSMFGLGHHNITLEARDPFGTMAYAYIEFDVLNAVNLTIDPYFEGEAVSEQEAYFQSSIQLPILGQNYAIGSGKSPLQLISIEILSTEDDSSDIGLRSISLDMNLSAMLASNIDLETVDLRHLPSLDSQNWTTIQAPNFYQIDEFGHALLDLVENGVILIIGTLPDANITAENLDWTLLEGGQIQLDWTIVGDTTNPYSGEWKMYKLQGNQGTTYFPDPSQGINEFIWGELVLTTHVDNLSLTTTQWTDPEPLETGICASYALAPTNREGEPNFQLVNITRVGGSAALLCGDAIPPSSVVTQFSHTWEFTNSTDCFNRSFDWSMCYNLNMSWTWPDHEPQGDLTWNLYRVEQAPNGVDLRYITPLVSDISSAPGEIGTFNQSGIEVDGIRPYRTYYYILAPIDSVGNEQTTATYPSGNVLRVLIEDDWWSYNQHLIPIPPPEPEPPLGIPWLQTLNENMQEPEFQLAGAVMLITIVLNFILLPIIVRKRKRLKRVLDARLRNSRTKYSDEFDDFFE